MSAVILEVNLERARQDAKWGEQNHPNGTGSDSDKKLADVAKAITDVSASFGRVTWKEILMEEVREVFAESDPALIREELVQVAAVAVQWIEALDRHAEALV